MRYVGPVDGHDIPALEHALRNAVELVRGRPDRRPRHHPEGPRLPAGRGRRREAPPRRPGLRSRRRAAEGRADRVHPGVRRGRHQGGRGRLRGSSRSPRRWPGRPGCCRSRPASPIASSTSASPSSTPSRAPPAWRWAGCARSSPSTRRSSTGRGTRSSTTSPCTACRSCSASTGPASPAPTDRATTACTTWRCWRGCRACACSRRRAPRSCSRCCTTRWTSPTAARSPSATRAARPATCPSTRSASASGPARVRAAEGDVAAAVCILAIGKLVEAAEKAADALAAAGVDVTVWDVRCCAPLDADMLADAARHRGVVTCEDGVRDGGIGMSIEDRIGAHRPGRPGRGARHADPVHPPRRPARADPRPARPRRRRNPGRRPPVPVGRCRAPPLGPRPVDRRLRPHVRRRRWPTRRRSPGAPRSSATSASGSPSTTT